MWSHIKNIIIILHIFWGLKIYLFSKNKMSLLISPFLFSYSKSSLLSTTVAQIIPSSVKSLFYPFNSYKIYIIIQCMYTILLCRERTALLNFWPTCSNRVISLEFLNISGSMGSGSYLMVLRALNSKGLGET